MNEGRERSPVRIAGSPGAEEREFPTVAIDAALQLQAIFEHSNAGLVLFDASPPYRVLATNRYYQQLWSEPYRSQGIVGVPLGEFASGAETAILGFFHEVVSSKKGKSIRDFPLDGMPGGRRLWNWSLEPVIQGDEAVALAHLVVDVTQEVACAEAQKATEEAAKAQSEFLAGISHEIRTPMTVILGALEHLEQSCAENVQDRQLVEMAQNAGERLLELVNDILDLSRIESRRVDVISEAFDLRACVEKTVGLFRLKAQEKSLYLGLSVSPDVPSIVHGDPSRLGQVLVNLIGNAVKFTERGEVNVTVSRGSAPRQLFICVQDTGIGIPADKQSLLFQSFNQLDPARTRKYGGSGLGLVITKKLVHLMGGKIGLKSTEGEGSIFCVILPLVETT